MDPQWDAKPAVCTNNEEEGATYTKTQAQHDAESARREVNALQKEIGTIKKAKGDASELLTKKAEIDKRIKELTARADELVKKRDTLAGRIGNIVDPTCHVSLTEVSYTVCGVRGTSWRMRS